MRRADVMVLVLGFAAWLEGLRLFSIIYSLANM